MADRFVRPPRQLVEATPTCDFRRIPEIRRPWPLQFMAANGRRENRRQHVRAGSACCFPGGVWGGAFFKKAAFPA